MIFPTQKNSTQLFGQNSHALGSEEEVKESGEAEANGYGEKVQGFLLITLVKTSEVPG